MRMRTQRILAALLSLVLLLALAPAGWAEGDNTEAQATQTCYAQIAPGGENVIADLKTANVVIDVYLVADMIKSTMYDTYSFKVTTPFSTTVTDASLNDPAIDKTGWEDLAEKALEVVQSGSATASTSVNVDATGGLASLTTTQGLYLLVAHTAGLTDYFKTITTSTASSSESDDTSAASSGTKLVTIAQSQNYEYQFAAQLITLPTKDAVDGVIMTSNPGPWLFGKQNEPLQFVLKPGQVYRHGDLKIVKTLDPPFAGPDPASFVFKITWKDGTKDEVRYVEITFTEAGEKEYILEKTIPVGTEVTVTEEHSGLQYSLVSSNGTATIAAVEEVKADSSKMATVTFENKHTGPGGGYGVVNTFTATSDGTEESKADYTWTKKADSGSTTTKATETDNS